MIIRPKARLFDVLFALRGSIARHIAARVLFMTVLACGAVIWTEHDPNPLAQLGTAPFTLLGLSISIFMSFRNNACYDRWWEGRKQWGALIIEIRSFAREIATIRSDPAHAHMLRGLCGFAYALAARLRSEDEAAAASPWLSPSPRPNVTDAVLTEIGMECSRLAEQGVISEWRYTVLEARLVGLSTVQAACERIRNTPLPFAYTLLIHRTAYLFCGLLPFGLAGQLGWITPLLVAIVSYTFFGLDAIGDQLEEPFGREENDLPLDAMVRLVERETLAASGATVLPAPLQPVDYVLL